MRRTTIIHLTLFLLFMVLGIILAPSPWMLVAAGAAGAVMIRPGPDRQQLVRLAVAAVLIHGVMLPSAVLASVIGQRLFPDAVTGRETMIIPGAAVVKDQPGGMLQERLDRALPLLKAHPEMRVIVSGARSSEDAISEARAMKRYLTRQGIASHRILEETRARDTIGNLEYSKELIQMNSLPMQVLLVTNDFHCLRAATLARTIGLDPVVRPVPTGPATFLRYLLRETASLVKIQFHYGLGLAWRTD